MADLRTDYAGLSLKNPLIVSSSGLTKSLDRVMKAYNAGAGAVVLKSLFEEQIMMDVNKTQHDSPSMHPEEYEYLKAYSIQDYLRLIEDSKKSCDIPIIASVNCVSSSAWIEYAKEIEAAGADALELNISILPVKEFGSLKEVTHWYYSKVISGPDVHAQTSEDVENAYLDILTEIKKNISIPVMFKIGPYFTSLIDFARKLDDNGINALVLFNMFFNPDFDIEKKEPIYKMKLSNPQDIGNTLRWISLINNEVKCDLSATTGVHDTQSCIKLLMAGANTIQLCSVLYKNGMGVIEKFINDISDWMDKHDYDNIQDLNGSLQKYMDVHVFSRMQYIKMYAEAE